MASRSTPRTGMRTIGSPVFAQPQPTPDPTVFRVAHPSDSPAYRAIDALNKAHKLAPLPFPVPRGAPEPQLSLQEVFGGAKSTIETITHRKQLVFHATGDCGSTKGPQHQNEVADKMTSDFDESDPAEIPQFNLLLGDVVYSFGEPNYYYDQFYEPYRDYPAPILAVAGNHDGMISPLAHAKSLEGYLRNFCANGFYVTPEAGGLSRTAQIQPGVFFTFDAPFVRILALYSNALEDPGTIADPKTIGTSQLDFLTAALKRVKSEQYAGALLIADHHPPYTVSRHGWSVEMLKQIDRICESTSVWPHAFLSGHAHNYQRFTRTHANMQIPYLVCGNGGHNVQRLTGHGVQALRAPQVIQQAGTDVDLVVLENYDDQNYGYLRIIVDSEQLRIEYHPATDGARTKTPDDSVTVDLKSRKLVHYVANNLGWPKSAAKARKLRTEQGH